jgi:hypothetical protein
MLKNLLIAPLAALFALGSSAMAVGLPIDTGYNYSPVFAPYALPPLNVASTIVDNYWINLSSFPQTTPLSPFPSYVLRHNGFAAPWAVPMPGSNWIGPRNKNTSATGTTSSNPAYTIFRKCFCLEQGFNSASLSFRVMNDNDIQIWLNTQFNPLLGPTLTSWATPSSLITSTPAQLKYLHAGTNCLYALLEDDGGVMGFDLSGTFNANGLYPDPAVGIDQTFRCPCTQGPAGRMAAPAADDQEVVSAIVKIAEGRRRARMGK